MDHHHLWLYIYKVKPSKDANSPPTAYVVECSGSGVSWSCNKKKALDEYRRNQQTVLCVLRLDTLEAAMK